MKKTLAALSLVALSGTALAAGAFDGIYAATAGTVGYLTVHQTGSSMIAGSYAFARSDGTIRFTYSGSSVTPPVIGVWDVFGGTISEATALLKGDMFNGACETTWELIFEGDTIKTRVAAITPTALGAQQQFACSRVLPINTLAQFKKVF
ncbi:hypothetical protein [Acidovorax sp.]|uniref:hypothetical protein n=1 Tax=Acidovorax sp. TaxID=1872122 RepID=UPI0031D858B3